MARSLTLRPPAKINWSLRIGARLDDGYHDVRTILQTIDLSDTLTFTHKLGPFEFISRSAEVPSDASNLICRAAQALWGAAGRAGDPRDVQIKLIKNIPVGAGLGGGSANAAAALVGLNAIWKCKLSARDLLHLGAALGADVPFFLVGGTALGVGRGDEVYPLEDVKPMGIVLIKPAFGVSTADAYGWLDRDREGGGVATIGAELAVGWPTGALDVANDLEAPVARRHPLINEAIDLCHREGALAAAMTGSGSAVFGVFSLAAVPRVVRRLRRQDWRVLPTRTISRAQARRRMTL